MERRKAVTAAAAASLTFVLGAAGMTANAAILGGSDRGGVGQISPITVPARAATRPTSSEDAPSTTIAATAGLPAAGAPPSADGVTPSPAPSADPSASQPRTGATAPAAAPHVAVASQPAPAPTPTVAPAPTPVPTTAPTVTGTGGSTTVTGADDTEIEDHEDEAPEQEHEAPEGSEDDD